ncbi:helix-turn-helix domain-containing protein [Pseudomonas asiatica]|uniref:helix-turn-helix domain-containing protein n=1 Tax=Pseudomonas asiatica TaxID=2219225 RepID=UPI002365D582|nr:helix-turn-helix transcriptional regulator [Pseudomonas asiatica]MDD1981808.1 helix-turn-helix transcriptional regulator [Pseudomonas asiatica]
MNVRELLVCALEKMMHDNDKNITILSLSAAVGISRSTIYKYYPDVVDRVRSIKHRSNFRGQESIALKASKLSQKVRNLESLVTTLTNVCSSQLSEISEIRLSYEDIIEGQKMKIAFLERELKKTKRPSLRAVDKD